MPIGAILFQALRDVESLALSAGLPHSGKRFEDFMVQQLYLKLQERGAPQVFPPRYTLREPTYSGLAHQFDIMVRQDGLVAVECKFREKTGIGELFAFRGKLADYLSPSRGIFVTTARKVHREMFCYGIAHHILVLCSSLPPVDYMAQRVKTDSDLGYRLAMLSERLQEGKTPGNLVIEWENACNRFAVEGYR